MPANPESLRQALEAMSRFFVGDSSVRETLQQVSDLACDAVPTADMVGLTMIVDGRPSTAVFTDDATPEIDTAQYESGIGPCLDAFRLRQVFRIDDMERDDQWPQFSAAAAAHGVRCSMSIPVIARHAGVGALNFYSLLAVPFSDDDVEVGMQFATHAAIVLANSQAYWEAHQLSLDLTEAMKSRATIEQAKGVLMAAQRCGPEDAFQVLVRASQRENRKLREIAEEIVVRTAEPRRGQEAS